MSEPYCHKHDASPVDERWQVAFQELVDEEDDNREPFEEHVCPICFLALRDKNRKNKRQLKVESKRALRLQAEVGSLQKVIDAVAKVVKEETGKDATELVGKVFPQPCRQGFPGRLGPISMDEIGTLERILPNLIVEAIRKKKSE